MKLEICIDSVESAIAAQMGGADRLELCSALSEGGITPSAGLIRQVCSQVSIPVFVIIRPRGGDFVYSDSEFQVMCGDIVTARELGCQGVVLGLLTASGQVDIERVRALVELARPMSVTFHRAIDAADHLEDAVEAAIQCGADRILSSGGRNSALDGAPALGRMRTRAAGRIAIMAGSGVRVGNIREIIQISGIDELHTSLAPSTQPARKTAGERAEIQGRQVYPLRAEDVRAFRAQFESVLSDLACNA